MKQCFQQRIVWWAPGWPPKSPLAKDAGSVGQPSAPSGTAFAAETRLSQGFTLSQGSKDSGTDGPKSLKFQADDSESPSSSRTSMVLAEAAVGHPYPAFLYPVPILCPLAHGLDPKATSWETPEH